MNFEAFFVVKTEVSRLSNRYKLISRCLVIAALWLDVDCAEDQGISGYLIVMAASRSKV